MVRKGPEKKRNYRECYSVTSPHHQEAWYRCRATVKVVNQSACESILQTVKPATCIISIAPSLHLFSRQQLLAFPTAFNGTCKAYQIYCMPRNLIHVSVSYLKQV